MLIYLDLCCFNRPFDDQGQLLVRLQTEAKLHVQQAIRDGVFQMAWSAVLDLENRANPDPDRREAIAEWRPLAAIDVDMSHTVETDAERILSFGIKPMDALHLASALNARADWFLTTDKGILRKAKYCPGIMIADPVDFVRALQEEGKHENG